MPEDNKQPGNRGHSFRRRNVLKSIGATGIALSGANLVRANTPSASDVIVIEGGFDNPIARSKVDEAIATANDEFVDRGGDPQTIAGKGISKADVGELAALAYMVDEQGRYESYYGFAADKRSVGDRHKRAAEMARRWR